MLASTQKSKKRQIQALLLILQLGLLSVMFITHTYNCRRTFLHNYRRNSSVSQLQLFGGAAQVLDSKRSWWGLPDDGAKLFQSQNAADMQS